MTVTSAYPVKTSVTEVYMYNIFPLAPARDNMTKLRVYLVRHGETDANRQQILQGQLNTQLNELGQEQARRVAERLQWVSFEVACTSDLSRAVKVRINNSGSME